jgi:hypothetical protein
MKKIIKSFTINKNNVNLNNDYICLVKIKKYNKSVPMCKYPKQKVSVIDRPPLRVYYNYNDEIIKKIIYPQELWYKPVYEDDIMENLIIEINNCIPSWESIEFIKN